MSSILDALLLSELMGDKKNKKTMSDPVSGFKKVKKLMAELKEEEKKAKEKKEDKGSFIQQVIILMMAGPLIGTFILWVMTYMLTDAINHLARIHN